MAPGGHRLGITAKHTCCAGPTWYVEVDEDEMKESLGNVIVLFKPPNKMRLILSIFVIFSPLHLPLAHSFYDDLSTRLLNTHALE